MTNNTQPARSTRWVATDAASWLSDATNFSGEWQGRASGAELSIIAKCCQCCQ